MTVERKCGRSVVWVSEWTICDGRQLMTKKLAVQNNLEKVGHVIEDFGSSFWRG